MQAKTYSATYGVLTIEAQTGNVVLAIAHDTSGECAKPASSVREDLALNFERSPIDAREGVRALCDVANANVVEATQAFGIDAQRAWKPLDVSTFYVVGVTHAREGLSNAACVVMHVGATLGDVWPHYASLVRENTGATRTRRDKGKEFFPDSASRTAVANGPCVTLLESEETRSKRLAACEAAMVRKEQRTTFRDLAKQAKVERGDRIATMRAILKG